MDAVQETVQVEVWVHVYETGEYDIAEKQADLPDAVGASRHIRVTLTVPRPRAIELSAVIPAEPETAQLKVA